MDSHQTPTKVPRKHTNDPDETKKNYLYIFSQKGQQQTKTEKKDVKE